MKPQLADNWEPEKIRFPLFQMPKIDGVRGLFITDQFTGRSLKPFKNKNLTAFWSQPEFKHLDGELVLPNLPWNVPRLCSLVTGMCNRVNEIDMPDLCVFDYLHPDLIAKGATYRDRYEELVQVVGKLGCSKVRLVPYHIVNSLEEVEALDAAFLDDGLEGSILRNPDAKYKEGRPSSKVQELMRIKTFIDCEARVMTLIEANENRNEAKTNELGRTERSTHKENMYGKGMVGMLRCMLEQDVLHDGKVLFEKGMVIDVGPGQMDHSERLHFWQNPDQIVGQVIKFKTFPHGTKDKPRFPVFLSLRSAEDLSQ